jgi:hypothetical protein
MSFFWPDIDKVAAALEAKERNQARKAAVRGNSNAYHEYMDGTKPLDIVRDPMKDNIDMIKKRVRQKFGLYDYSFPSNSNSSGGTCEGIEAEEAGYDEAASRALLSICNDIKVKSYHISDLLEAGADPNYCDGSRYNETPIYGVIRYDSVGA